jgi:phospholipid/cholesterol/gamma-HCH transport system substrate-binding protein
MMKRLNVEIVVGLFVLLGLACVSYLAIKLGDVGLFQDNTYPLKAQFISISGLKEGAPVELAGVKIGKVANISLEPELYEAEVEFAIDRNVKLQDDVIASIRTQGIIGDKFVKISPGGSDKFLEAGMTIEETESAISLEELVSKYMFEGGSKSETTPNNNDEFDLK